MTLFKKKKSTKERELSAEEINKDKKLFESKTNVKSFKKSKIDILEERLNVLENKVKFLEDENKNLKDRIVKFNKINKKPL